MTMNAIEDNDSATSGQAFDLRLPGRRLRCACGHWITSHDFDVFGDGRFVRAVCPRCHDVLLELEME